MVSLAYSYIARVHAASLFSRPACADTVSEGYALCCSYQSYCIFLIAHILMIAHILNLFEFSILYHRISTEDGVEASHIT